ncbi:MAG TPA: hypothetical protein VK154_02085 [Chitinophagales bacterium]|nr:hypothetical protein [Chitinophagales bacterium]
MNQEYKICLLKVGPQADDTRDVSYEITHHLHNYLNLKNFSSQIRFGKQDNISSSQLNELRAKRENILDVIKAARENNKSIHTSIIINLEITD